MLRGDDVDALTEVAAGEEAVLGTAAGDPGGGDVAGPVVSPETGAVGRAQGRGSRPGDPALRQQAPPVRGEAAVQVELAEPGIVARRRVDEGRTDKGSRAVE